MKWLITGGCGFIGTALIRRLLEEASSVHGIRIVDNLSVGGREDLARACNFSEVSSEIEAGSLGEFPETGVEFVEGDILDADLALSAARGADIIVHLAANTGVEPSIKDPRADCASNVIGVLNYLEAARHENVGRLVLASSGAALGETEPPLHEEKAPHPASPYGASKLAGEGYCSAYYRTFGVETVALRFGNVYGPGSGHKNSAVARFIKRAMDGQALQIYGDGTQTRDYIYIEDLIEAVHRAATVPGVGGETFQIATSAETTVLELVEELKAALAASGFKEVEVRHTAPRAGDPSRNYADTSRAYETLGWRYEVELYEGLRRTVRWFADGGSRTAASDAASASSAECA